MLRYTLDVLKNLLPSFSSQETTDFGCCFLNEEFTLKKFWYTPNVSLHLFHVENSSIHFK